MLAEKWMKMVWNGVAYNKYENLYNVIRKYAENNLQEQIIARAMTYSGYGSDNPSVQMFVEISATHDICEDIIKHEVKVVPNITSTNWAILFTTKVNYATGQNIYYKK